MKRVLLFLLVLLLSVFSMQIARAGTTYTWAGGSSGSWTTSANWSPSSGYPGSSGTTDIAIVNTSNATITLSSTITIGQLKTTNYGVSGITISVNSGITLNIGSGVSTSQPSSAAVSFTFSGSGAFAISGTVSAGYNSSFAISSGTTVYFNSNAVMDESTSNPHGNLTNAGTLNIMQGCTFKFGDFSSLTNSGVMRSYNSTFNFSGSGTPANLMTNTGTYTDHGSTFTISGQNSAFQNSGSSSLAYLHGTKINFTSTNNNMSLINAGMVIADSSASFTLGTYNCPLTNTGTFYAGGSNNPCTINLTGQGSNINNSGTFYVGSTSGITISGYQAYLNNASAGFFIFQSDSYGSGYLGAVPSTSVGMITGSYQVQRYITGGSSSYRGYRMFSSPVYASTVSSNKVYSLNYVQGSALVTGSGGTTGGFDKTGNPSLYLYRENIAYSNATFISGNFRGIANIASAPSYTMDTDGGPYNIPVGNGFLFWFRGDRTTNLANKYTPGTVAESVTMTATGSLNQGSYTVHDWYTPSSSNLGYTTTSGNTSVRGDNLVGNPYPSSIDWETFQTTTSTSGIYGVNVGNTIYVLNPLNQNYGAYIKGGGGVGTNNATNVIASGQGFFVVATGTGAQLIFNETAKSTAQNTGLQLFMDTHTGNMASNSFIKLKMSMDTVNTDELLVRFDNNASAIYSGAYDSEYKTGFGKVSLSSLSADSVSLAINTVPYPKTSEAIKLSVSAKKDGIYQLNLAQVNQVPQLYDIWLKDNYTKDSVDLRPNPVYRFNIYTADPASYGSGRFILIIRQNPAYAYQLINFNAAKVQGESQVQVSWQTMNEGNYTNFTVERSTDSAKTFNIIGSMAATGAGSYSLTDKFPVMGANLYRLKQQDINGDITYSAVVKVMYPNPAGIAAGNLSVYPNPAAGTLNLSINTPGDNGRYYISIVNSLGLTVKQATVSQPSWQGTVNDLPPGTYTVRVLDNKNNTELGSSRFVKL
ncbi:MAG: T9SS type A sorting domain-containing protein [Bacteroidetes bacterium]|nr:T9SS type A sorting domain-containing protein [Bacteroidota bacterium]